MTTPLTVYTAPMPEPWASLLTAKELVVVRRLVELNSIPASDTYYGIWPIVWRWTEGFTLTNVERVRDTAAKIIVLCRAAEALAATLETE